MTSKKTSCRASGMTRLRPRDEGKGRRQIGNREEETLPRPARHKGGDGALPSLFFCGRVGDQLQARPIVPKYEKTTKAEHGIGYLATLRVDHHLFDRANLVAIGTINRCPLRPCHCR